MASRVDFYHLTRDGAPAVAARLAERVIAARGRLLVVAGDSAARSAIDVALWSAIPDSFLPHPAPASGPDPACDDPIQIVGSLDGAAGTGATTVAIADGEWREESLAFARTLFLFDGQHIDDARAAWRQLTRRDDVECHYWQQDQQGKWRQGP